MGNGGERTLEHAKESQRTRTLNGALDAELGDALELLRYAASVGIDVGPEVRGAVVDASLRRSEWSQTEAENFLAALTELSAKLSPVTAESLRLWTSTEAHRSVRWFRYLTLGLAAVVAVFSAIAYVATTTCDGIGKDIETANGLAVIVGVEAWPAAPAAPTGAALDSVRPAPPSETRLTHLQQLSALMRTIRGRAEHLSLFHFLKLPARKRYELPAPGFDMVAEAAKEIAAYQEVRFDAQTVRENVSTWFGAATTCFLPALYAILGAVAYLARIFEGQLKARTFTGSEGRSVRLCIAAIGGLVVGLFGGFGSSQAALPPLGIAFLAGYGLDVFFMFLDGLLQPLRSTPAPAKTMSTVKAGPAAPGLGTRWLKAAAANGVPPGDPGSTANTGSA